MSCDVSTARYQAFPRGSWGLRELAGWWIQRGDRAAGFAGGFAVCCRNDNSTVVISLALVSRVCRPGEGLGLRTASGRDGKNAKLVTLGNIQ